MQESSRITKIGLIGCGRWGRNILRDLLALGCTVHVADTSRESLKLAKAAGATETVTETRALPTVDAVVIATPSSIHAQSIEEVCDRKIPIFVEKPMTTSIQSGQKLLDAVGDRLFVMDKWRYHPAVQLLANIARTNELGPLVGLSMQRLQWGSPHQDVDGIWILAPHDLSIALEILGYIPEPDHALSDSHKGVPAGLYAHFKGKPWLRINVSTRSFLRSRRIELHCQEGIALFDSNCENQVLILRGSIEGVNECSNSEIRSLPNPMPLLEELKGFVEYVHGGPAPKSNAAIGYDVVCKIIRLRELAGIPLEQLRCEEG
jgi:predicted dehydrogenase